MQGRLVCRDNGPGTQSQSDCLPHTQTHRSRPHPEGCLADVETSCSSESHHGQVAYIGTVVGSLPEESQPPCHPGRRPGSRSRRVGGRTETSNSSQAMAPASVCRRTSCKPHRRFRDGIFLPLLTSQYCVLRHDRGGVWREGYRACGSSPGMCRFSSP